MTPITVAIAAASWKMWTRELCRVLRVSRRAAVLLAAAAVASALTFGGLLASMTVQQIRGDLPPELDLTIARSSLAGVWLTSGLLASVFALTVPPRTMLQSLLDLLPVSRRAATFGQLAPMSMVTTVFCVALATPTFAIFSRLFSGAALAVAWCAVVLSIALAQVLALTIFLIASWAARRLLRLATRYADTLAALVVMSLCGWMASRDLLARDIARPAEVDLLPHRILAAWCTGEVTPWTSLVAVVWLAATVGLIVVAGSVRPTSSDPRLPSFLRGWRPRDGSFRSLLWFEMITTVRTVQFVMTAVAALALVGVAMLLQGDPAAADLARSVAAAAPIAPFAVGMYAVGRTLPFHWIGDHLAASHLVWALANAAASFVTATSVSLPIVFLAVGSGVLPVEGLIGVVTRALLAGTLALLAGALIPVSQEQPISTTAAAFLCGVFLLGGSLGVNAAVQMWGAGALAVTAAASALGLGLYVRVCERHITGERVHG